MLPHLKHLLLIQTMYKNALYFKMPWYSYSKSLHSCILCIIFTVSSTSIQVIYGFVFLCCFNISRITSSSLKDVKSQNNCQQQRKLYFTNLSCNKFRQVTENVTKLFSVEMFYMKYYCPDLCLSRCYISMNKIK
jgi:hypothetical protein